MARPICMARPIRASHLRRRARTFLVACGVAWVVLGAAAQTGAHAQEHELSPPRALATLSVGVPLRLSRNVDLGQDTFAPGFVDALFGYVFRSSGLQHGPALGVSMNLSSDGGFSEPVGAGQQLALMPGYLAYHPLNDDFVLLGHAGLPIALGSTTTAGLELALGAGYRWLAGVLAYAELGANTFLGTGSTAHVMLSLELGVMFDYEVLP